MSGGEGGETLEPLIEAHRLPWEALPTWANADPDVWRAMLPHLGLTALIRNLGNMTRIGAIKPLDGSEQALARASCRRGGDPPGARASARHPAGDARLRGPAAGARRGVVDAVAAVVLDALDGAFYKAFANVEPTGKRHLIALDVSGSMGSQFGGSVLTCREATAALALVTMAVEKKTHVVGFTAAVTPAPVRRPVGRGDGADARSPSRRGSG